MNTLQRIASACLLLLFASAILLFILMFVGATISALQGGAGYQLNAFTISFTPWVGITHYSLGDGMTYLCMNLFMLDVIAVFLTYLLHAWLKRWNQNAAST